MLSPYLAEWDGITATPPLLAGRQHVVYSRATFIQTESSNSFDMAHMPHKPITSPPRALRAAIAGLRLNLLLLP